MEVSPEFVVSDEAIEQARALGLLKAGDAASVREQMLRMVRQSAPFSEHPVANRRFEGFMMKIEGQRLVLISRIDHNPVKARYRQKWEERIKRKENRDRAEAEGKTFIDLTRE